MIQCARDTSLRFELTSERPMNPPIPNSYVVAGARLSAGEYPGVAPSRSEAEAVKRLDSFLDAGVSTFVDLTDIGDNMAPYEPRLQVQAAARNTRVTRHALPVPDLGVPTIEAMRVILDTIDSALERGEHVYVHCWGGVGRTGTVIACWLVRRGANAESALGQVQSMFSTMTAEKVRRHKHSGSPQTEGQRQFVRDWVESAEPVPDSLGDWWTARRQNERMAVLPIETVVPRASRPFVSRRESDVDTEEIDHSANHRDDGLVACELARNAGRIQTAIRGCLLGGALGDALGWPVEFLPLSAIRAQFGPTGIQLLDASAPGGLGAITDDTQMTLFTAEGILRGTTRWMERNAYGEMVRSDWAGRHSLSEGCMMNAYRRWLKTQGAAPRIPHESMEADGWLIGIRQLHVRRAPGNTCLDGLNAFLRGERARDEGMERAPNDSKGCGAVMRVAPVGLVPTDDPFEFARAVAGMSHGHPSGILSACAYAHIVHRVLYYELPLAAAVVSALERLQSEPGAEETFDALSKAYELARTVATPSAKHVESLGGGWTGDEALAIGVFSALVAEDFVQGVRLAVNHSGDSDSTGGIAGALLGLQCGQYGLPADWLEVLEMRETIMSVADDLLIGYGGGDAWRTRYPPH
jgi:ADP-ribosyl-[dinitrogen reductase] hydrolase